jgi:hypothetical protein
MATAGAQPQAAAWRGTGAQPVAGTFIRWAGSPVWSRARRRRLSGQACRLAADEHAVTEQEPRQVDGVGEDQVPDLGGHVGIACQPPRVHGHICIGNPMNMSCPGAMTTLRRTRDAGGGICLEPPIPGVE